MMRVLVSGGTGFVGRFIVEHLLQNGYEVAVGGRTAPARGLFSKPVDFVPLSLDPGLDQAAAVAGMEGFVHAAFEHVEGKYRGGEGDDPDGFRHANIEGSRRLFETARAAGVKRCVFLSSRAVYGSRLAGTADETTPTEPDTLYGEVKRAAESRLRALAAHDFCVANLRVTGVYGAVGPGKKHKWAELFSAYLEGRPVESRIGTEVHGDDVAAAVRLMLEADAGAVSGEVFNVSDLLLDTSQILSIVRMLTECPHSLPATVPPTGYLVMSTDKLRALGWQPGGTARLKATVRELLADISPV